MALTVSGGDREVGGTFLVETERFQGPLDLLLHLIRTQDIDVLDIPISRITDQFLKAIQGLAADDLDGAGEFLEMAATLVRIKATSCGGMSVTSVGCRPLASTTR